MAAMKRIALREGWNTYNMDEPSRWVGVRRTRNLASILQEEDHLAAVKSFFVESLRQLREDLTAFKKEHPELPWEGS